jgi:serine/threonine-protein kinase
MVVLADAAVAPGDAAIAMVADAREPTVAVDAVVATLEPDAGIEVEPTPDAAVVVKSPKRPPKLPKPSPSPTPVASKGEPGTITIDSSPVYAVIYIDGKKLGETPLIDIKLSPGRHSVRAVSSSGGTKTMSITIESGKKARGRRIEW